MSDRTNDSRRSGGVDRRTFLKRAGAVGAGVVVGRHLSAPDVAVAQDATFKPDPAAKRGGTLRYGVHTAPVHFDVHQSGTVANIGAQAPMYDLLIRRDPRDGQTIIPDLAQRWEVSPDNRKYTFHLRHGVKFHDGADFTAEDVKATYEKLVNPPKGVVSPRTPLFSAVSDIVVLDPHKIEFRLKEARPKAFILAGTRFLVPDGQARVRPAARSGVVAQGQGNAGHDRGRVQPERRAGRVHEQQETAAGRRPRPSGHAPRARSTRARRRRQGRRAHAGGRLRVPVPRDVDAAGRADQQAPRLSERQQGRRAGGQEAHGRGRPRRRDQEPDLSGPGRRHLQALVRRHPGNAEG